MTVAVISELRMLFNIKYIITQHRIIKCGKTQTRMRNRKAKVQIRIV